MVKLIASKFSLSFLLTMANVSLVLGQDSTKDIDFGKQILPLLASQCFECHGPDANTREADLRLDTKLRAFGETSDGDPVLIPGQPKQSALYQRISSHDDLQMPPVDSGKSMSVVETELIRIWIKQGAHWETHWSLIAPQRPEVPDGYTGNPIDAFIRHKLKRLHQKQSEEADKRSLIRRVTLDLTGLPPSIKEVHEFVEDQSPLAYERLVDRLLASSQYGEHMAVAWLDAARYADTHGYLFDTERTMWRWRDWVIDSFNRNQPYDEFTIEQLAGDLLANPTFSQKLATGFNRNHLINNEAGAIPAEYLVENVLDRVNTTATVWMGLSLACCQCHDHKYDPFTQREYYEFYAFFNTLSESGLDGFNANAKPLMKAPTEMDHREIEQLRSQVETAKKVLESLRGKIESGQAKWESRHENGSHDSTRGLVAHWTFDQSSEDSLNIKMPSVFEAAAANYDDGILGDAAKLEGLGYINAGDRFNFTAKDTFSIATWVRPDNKLGRMSLVSRMMGPKDLYRGYVLQTLGGIPSFYLLNKFPGDMIRVQAEDVLEPGQWHHVAVSYDGSGKAAGVKLYINGQYQKPTINIDQLAGPITTESPFWIGNGHPGAKLKGRMDEVRIYDRVLSAEEVQNLPGLSIGSLLNIAEKERNEEQRRRIRNIYLTQHAPKDWRAPYESFEELKVKVKKFERDIPTVMVMEESINPRKTNLLIRGAYNKLGEEVSAATPSILPPMNSELPVNRLGLARWLVDPSHPLTARVAVNRYWQSFFGRGIVATPGDFGVQGELPSHPELLDWLACEFIDGGWDVKSIQKLIVTSETYRQSSQVTQAGLNEDPDNRFLSRGPRKRISAEMIRDQALAVSGLLIPKIGGPSVRPYQPAGLWRDVAFDFTGANLTAQIYEQDSGEDLYRRSLYTFRKRTAPPPGLLLFDAPSRERCVVRRDQTNTPLQALALMNDTTFVEASRKLAERAMIEIDGDAAARVSHCFELVTARQPEKEELDALVRLYKNQKNRFGEEKRLARELLSVGESTSREDLIQIELAALTLVGNVILNLDETVTPR